MSAKIYRVYDLDKYDEIDAVEIKADSFEEAAEEYAEKHDPEKSMVESNEEMTVIVERNGEKRIYKVHTEVDISYIAEKQ